MLVEHLALYQLYQYIPIYKQRKQVFHRFRLDGYDTVNMKLTTANLIDKKQFTQEVTKLNHVI
jgi:hypothetical protein